ncbi:MAG: DUF418 domain-containing protein [bacterium]|nr:DUF418 domain-containing protein [bacterium]
MTDNAQGNETQEVKSGFFEEDNGNRSAIRLMSFGALVSAVIFGILTILIANVDTQSGILITFGFLLAAFAPKAFQKFAETKTK